MALARARFAVSSLPQESKTPTHRQASNKSSSQGLAAESHLIQNFTKQARENYAAHPELLPKIELPADIQEMADFDARLDAALEKSAKLLDEAKAQLAAPCVAPDELTAEEIAELERKREWDRRYAEADAFNDAWLARNENLFNEVMGLIDECEAKGTVIPDDVVVPEPPPTPTLEGMKAPESIAAWIRDSKKHIPQSPPKPSAALEALKEIQAKAAASPAKQKKRRALDWAEELSGLNATLFLGGITHADVWQA